MNSILDFMVQMNRHGKFALAIFSGVFAVLFAIGMMVPKKYKVATTIEIGSILEGEALKSIETPEKLKVKIESSFVPEVREGLQEDFDVDVKIPARSMLVVLESRAPYDLFDSYVDFHQQLVERIKEDHRQVAEPSNNKVVARRDKEVIALAELKDPGTLMQRRARVETQLINEQSKLERLKEDGLFGRELEKQRSVIGRLERERDTLEEKKSLLLEAGQRLAENRLAIGAQLARVEREYASLAGVGGDATKSLENPDSVSLRESSATSLMEQITNLQQQFYVVLPGQRVDLDQKVNGAASQIVVNDRDLEVEQANLSRMIIDNDVEKRRQSVVIAEVNAKMEKTLSDYERDVQKQQAVVDEISSLVKLIGNTRAVAPPALESTSGQPSRKIILAVAFLIGLMAAFGAVLLRILIRQVSEMEQAKSVDRQLIPGGQ